MNRLFFCYRTILTCVVMTMLSIVTASGTESSQNGEKYHVWEMVEVTLTSRKTYNNPFTEMTVWLDLKGPGFNKRCYGFWDGGNTFRIRITATTPGTWTWKSGSKPADPG